jgi:hypothetical protein
MEREKVKNGRLYFNKARKQVEQVRSSASGNSVITSRKDGQAMVAKADDLRRASKREMGKYLES